MYFGDLEQPKDIKGSTFSTGFGNFIHLLAPEEEWEFAHPKEGVPGTMDFTSLVNHKQMTGIKEKISYEWINFTLSEHYQRAVIMEGNGEMPVITKFERPLTPYQIKRFQLNNIEYYKKSRFLWPARSRANTELMEKLWKEALEQ